MRKIFKLKIWKTSSITIAAIILISSAVVFYELKKEIKTSRAGAGHNIFGWAWSSTIGWISLNDLNCDVDGDGKYNDGGLNGCPNDDSDVFPYGVNVDLNLASLTFEEISGQAWSENIGWISFDRALTGAPPGAPYVADAFIAKVDNGTGKLYGWARALSACQDDFWDGTKCTSNEAGNKSGGWDGWIKLRKDPTDGGPDYGVSLNGNSFTGWAWGGGTNAEEAVIGWISFDSAEEIRTWAKAYGGDNIDIAHIIRQTSDGGYLMAGHTESFGVNQQDAYLSKVDQDGNFLWANAYGGNGDEQIFSLQEISDGNYIATGFTNSGGAGQKDIFVMKIDSTGTLLWPKAKIFGGAGDDTINRITVYKASTEELIAGGYSKSFSDGGMDALVTKFNSDGVLIEMKNLGGAGYDTFREVQETSDGNYIATGQSQSYTDNRGNILIVKFDSDINKIWAKEYGKINLKEAAVSIQQVLDGGYIVFIYAETVLGGPEKFIIMKIDSSGTPIWAKSYKKADFDSDHARFSCQTLDNGFALGVVSYDGAGGGNLLLVKIDSDGNQEWARSFGDTDLDGLNFIEQTSDGGYIVAGRTKNFGVGDTDALVIKLDQNGNIQDCTPPLKDVGVIPYLDLDVATDVSETVVADNFKDIFALISKSEIDFTTTSSIPFIETDVCAICCNAPPTATTVAVLPIDYCSDSLLGIELKWNFIDAEDNPSIPQTGYKINLERSDLISCSIVKNPDVSTSITGTEINAECGGFIAYGGYTYIWDVEVYDSVGNNSAPVAGNPFPDDINVGGTPNLTPDHQYPIAKFEFTPAQPPATILQFQSIDFDPLLSQAFGGFSVANWTWDFGDGLPFVSINNDNPPITDGKVTYFYPESGLYKVDLKITDDSPQAYYCWASQNMPVNTKNITINGNKPKWNEVSP